MALEDLRLFKSMVEGELKGKEPHDCQKEIRSSVTKDDQKWGRRLRKQKVSPQPSCKSGQCLQKHVATAYPRTLKVLRR